MKRLIAALLFGAILLSTAACGSDSGTSSDTTTASGTQTTIPEDTGPELVIPDEYKDLNGYEFRVITREGNLDYMYIEEETGNLVDDAIYKRNRAVEEALNCKISVIGKGAWYQTDEMATLQAGDDAYDLLIAHGRSAFIYAANGLAMNLNDIGTIDLDAPWWNQDLRRCLEINGKLFAVGSSITHHTLASSLGMYFSKPLFEDYGIEEPYQLVRDGKWTFDKFEEYAKMFSSDLNNDGKFDLDNDLIGVKFYQWFGMVSIFNTTGYNTVTPDSDGYPRLTVYNETTVEMFERLMTLLTSECGKVTTDANNSDKAFWEKRVAMTDTKLINITSTGDKEMDFGVIPMPKYNEDVDKYYSLVEAGSDTVFIPITVKDPEIVGMVTEALSYYGEKIIIPAFYDNAVLNRYVRDEESVEMMEIIRQNMTFDLGYFNQQQFGSTLANPGANLAADTTMTFTTFYNQYKQAVETTIENSMEFYLDD